MYIRSCARFGVLWCVDTINYSSLQTGQSTSKYSINIKIVWNLFCKFVIHICPVNPIKSPKPFYALVVSTSHVVDHQVISCTVIWDQNWQSGVSQEQNTERKGSGDNGDWKDKVIKLLWTCVTSTENIICGGM